MQQCLFSNPNEQILPLADAKVQYLANWLDNETADSLLHLFQHELDWSEGEIKIFGKMIKIPRLQAWYGDEGANYEYSGVSLPPLTWHDELQTLKARCEEQCGSGLGIAALRGGWFFGCRVHSF